MTYLNDVQEGDETVFPMLGVNVKPERGKHYFGRPNGRMLTLEKRLKKEISILLRDGCIFRTENMCRMLQSPKVAPKG